MDNHNVKIAHTQNLFLSESKNPQLILAEQRTKPENASHSQPAALSQLLFQYHHDQNLFSYAIHLPHASRCLRHRCVVIANSLSHDSQHI